MIRAQVKTGRGKVDAQRVASTPTTTERALAILIRERANMDGVAASMLGAQLWPERIGRVFAVQGGGDYAAQMLLGRMRKAGLVRVARGEGSSRWELTSDGYRAAVRIPDVAEVFRVRGAP